MIGRLSVGVVGLGLIGSSVVRGLVGAHDVVGVDPDPDAVATVAGLGVRTARTWRDLTDCDVVLLAAPTRVNASILDQLMGTTPDARVADLGSVKAAIDETARRNPGFRFVGTHPMAGSERSGAESGTPDLFRGSAWPVVLHHDTDPHTLLFVLRLVLELGGHPVPMTAARHDAVVALASHLPHLLSGALGAVVADSGASDLVVALAGGSFRDVGRVGGSPPARTAEFLAENAQPAAQAARAAAAALTAVADHLADEEVVQQWLAAASDLRRQYDNRGAQAGTVSEVPGHAELRDLLVRARDSGARLVALRDDGGGRLTLEMAGVEVRR